MFLAALAFPFLKIRGVEFLPALFEIACQVRKNYYLMVPEKDQVKGERESAEESELAIQLYEDDILKIDWSDADIVFAASLLFSENLMKGIVERMKLLKRGTRMITLKMFQVDEDWELKHSLRVRMSWGFTSVYILEKMA